MLLSTSAFRIEIESLFSFFIKLKNLEIATDNPEGQQFWMFAKEREAGTLTLWAFGLEVIVCRKLAGESWRKPPL